MEKILGLEVASKNVFVKVYEVSEDVPNIIFIMTPIVSVNDKLSRKFMDGLLDCGCNVFAVDFLGIGKSEGHAVDISYINMKLSIQKLMTYIQKNYSEKIYIYGATGTGGLIGQALCADKEIGSKIAGFIQYGVGIYGDLSIMGNSKALKLSFPIIKTLSTIMPERKLKFKIPRYSGFKSEEENQWYKETMAEYPGAFDFNYSLLSMLFRLFFDKESTLKNKLICPVLVLSSNHDRYYYNSYVDRYYNGIEGPKDIKRYEDSHLAFYWRAKEINGDVINWIRSRET